MVKIGKINASSFLLGQTNAILVSKRAMIGSFIEWAAIHRVQNIGDLDIRVLEEYRSYLHQFHKPDGNPLNITTQRIRLISVTKFIDTMNYYGVIDGAFAKKFRLPRLPRRLPRDIPSIDDIERVMS